MPEADALAKAEAEAISLFQNPPRDMDEAALLFAQKGTFTADLPPALKNLQNVFNHMLHGFQSNRSLFRGFCDTAKDFVSLENFVATVTLDNT
jgi:hypothetical protein